MEFTSVNLGESSDQHDGKNTLAASGEGHLSHSYHPSTSHTLTTNQSGAGILSAISDIDINLASVESLILADPLCVGVVNQENGYTPLHIASLRGHCGLMKLLIDHGSDLEARGNIGETPLLLACQVGTVVECVCMGLLTSMLFTTVHVNLSMRICEVIH